MNIVRNHIGNASIDTVFNDHAGTIWGSFDMCCTTHMIKFIISRIRICWIEHIDCFRSKVLRSPEESSTSFISIIYYGSNSAPILTIAIDVAKHIDVFSTNRLKYRIIWRRIFEIGKRNDL